ncbi:hypothetical protein SERLA73DRAFT_142427 [Serpula lacrymans var. lacrymans S7.3]|uniref:Uncharacterized protein n=2 Tax=Serpula lacrymans var. lacrymans TaxID=341189 RepID=F8Q7S8_SERL3|nr:hypothetical protein SERLA73DRAFT_142427 [Serpula lacrymans var. lacrymans S7.3]
MVTADRSNFAPNSCLVLRFTPKKHGEVQRAIPYCDGHGITCSSSGRSTVPVYKWHVKMGPEKS